ncbi:peptidoglycan DD-metalloendopeptidase family protein [Jonesia quinghaiensis]|uniref:peptidoglycan DD-metalloendopeptidase family protein n=1 Tax=Jonesia quinghaiensis TaxID=262806 RepID=UPI0003F98243|nr:peptidoglycan DD-metalloendopeptidase family protein [Jonesia quinghaiensis]
MGETQHDTNHSHAPSARHHTTITRRMRQALAVGTATVLGILGATVPAHATAPAPVQNVITAKTQKFAYPLKAKSYRISSKFGARCIPVRGGSTMHLGEDLAAPSDSKIYAIADGTVRYTVNGTSRAAGYIGVEHKVNGRTYISAYVHVWNAKRFVKVGDKVTAGQKIGLVGNSGASTAPHLHLELWRDAFHGKGTAINPVTFLKERGVDVRGKATSVTTAKAPATCSYYTALYSSLRTDPSSTAKALTTLKPNSVVVHKPGQSKAGFIPVTVDGRTGWVAMGTVQPRRAAVPAIKKTVRYHAVVKKTVVRSKTSSTSAKVKTIATGTKVKVLDVRKNGWAKVSVQGKTGWVKPGTVRLTDKRYRVTAATTMRKTAWSKGAAVSTLASRKTVNIRGAESGWTYVSVGGKDGWVPSSSVKYFTVSRMVN